MLPSSARHRLKVTVAAADLLPIPLHHRVSIVSVSRDPTMAIALFPSFSDHLVHNGGRGADNRWKVGREGPTVVPRGMKQRRHRSFPGQFIFLSFVLPHSPPRYSLIKRLCTIEQLVVGRTEDAKNSWLGVRREEEEEALL
ncbi:hypothetical protein VPH35_117612 [Triticum aestivum]|uniref:Uncharacterized protein n=1 Tax=Aegilops tauschii subsp. strangulata TaxID=200361 RepID=A0A453P9T5_AEGTS